MSNPLDLRYRFEEAAHEVKTLYKYEVIDNFLYTSLLIALDIAAKKVSEDEKKMGENK